MFTNDKKKGGSKFHACIDIAELIALVDKSSMVKKLLLIVAL